MADIRMTYPTLLVLDVIAKATQAGEQVWGLRICQGTGLSSGTVYPILERLLDAGFLSAALEGDQPSGRPRRRFYELTGAGRQAHSEAVARRTQHQKKAALPGYSRVGWST